MAQIEGDSYTGGSPPDEFKLWLESSRLGMLYDDLVDEGFETKEDFENLDENDLKKLWKKMKIDKIGIEKRFYRVFGISTSNAQPTVTMTEKEQNIIADIDKTMMDTTKLIQRLKVKTQELENIRNDCDNAIRLDFETIFKILTEREKSLREKSGLVCQNKRRMLIEEETNLSMGIEKLNMDLKKCRESLQSNLPNKDEIFDKAKKELNEFKQTMQASLAHDGIDSFVATKYESVSDDSKKTLSALMEFGKIKSIYDVNDECDESKTNNNTTAMKKEMTILCRENEICLGKVAFKKLCHKYMDNTGNSKLEILAENSEIHFHQNKQTTKRRMIVFDQNKNSLKMKLNECVSISNELEKIQNDCDNCIQWTSMEMSKFYIIFGKDKDSDDAIAEFSKMYGIGWKLSSRDDECIYRCDDYYDINFKIKKSENQSQLELNIDCNTLPSIVDWRSIDIFGTNIAETVSISRYDDKSGVWCKVGQGTLVLYYNQFKNVIRMHVENDSKTIFTQAFYPNNDYCMKINELDASPDGYFTIESIDSNIYKWRMECGQRVTRCILPCIKRFYYGLGVPKSIETLSINTICSNFKNVTCIAEVSFEKLQYSLDNRNYVLRGEKGKLFFEKDKESGKTRMIVKENGAQNETTFLLNQVVNNNTVMTGRNMSNRYWYGNDAAIAKEENASYAFRSYWHIIFNRRSKDIRQFEKYWDICGAVRLPQVQSQYETDMNTIWKEDEIIENNIKPEIDSVNEVLIFENDCSAARYNKDKNFWKQQGHGLLKLYLNQQSSIIRLEFIDDISKKIMLSQTFHAFFDSNMRLCPKFKDGVIWCNSDHSFGQTVDSYWKIKFIPGLNNDKFKTMQEKARDFFNIIGNVYTGFALPTRRSNNTNKNSNENETTIEKKLNNGSNHRRNVIYNNGLKRKRGERRLGRMNDGHDIYKDINEMFADDGRLALAYGFKHEIGLIEYEAWFVKQVNSSKHYCVLPNEIVTIRERYRDEGKDFKLGDIRKLFINKNNIELFCIKGKMDKCKNMEIINYSDQGISRGRKKTMKCICHLKNANNGHSRNDTSNGNNTNNVNNGNDEHRANNRNNTNNRYYENNRNNRNNRYPGYNEY